MPKTQQFAKITEKTKREFAERQREGAAACESVRRKLLGFLQCWKFCGSKHCLRAQTCAGNAFACFDRFWPLVPERMKVSIREGMKARVAGLTKPEITAQIVRAGARWDQLEAAAAAERALMPPRR